MKKFLWLLSIVSMLGLASCGGGSSEEAKALLQKILNLVGIPQSIVVNICQDENRDGICGASELQVEVAINQGDSAEDIWQKITNTEEGKYLLETYDSTLPILVEFQDSDVHSDDGNFMLHFDGLTNTQEEKELSILESMIDAEHITEQNVQAIRDLDNQKDQDKFYKVLFQDLKTNINTLKDRNLTSTTAMSGNIQEMANELLENGVTEELPNKINSCSGDDACVDKILEEISNELIIHDKEIVGAEDTNSTEINSAETNSTETNSSSSKVDLSKYFSKESTIKNFTKKEDDPYSEESISSTSSKVEISGNSVRQIYQYGSDNEHTTTFLINEDTITATGKEGDVYEPISRYIDIGDTTFSQTYSGSDEYGSYSGTMICTFNSLIESFSHGGYEYSGDILEEKCDSDSTRFTEDGTYRYKYGLYRY
ncbi:hypothetical protein GSY74_08145, partial [Sulfurovum sp. bin170]|uniref:hypothetical protein n=1 Tax=Sulfurovum sp. bin170 TaxID=2695268 RepID=UPI0013DFBF7A